MGVLDLAWKQAFSRHTVGCCDELAGQQALIGKQPIPKPAVGNRRLHLKVYGEAPSG